MHHRSKQLWSNDTGRLLVLVLTPEMQHILDREANRRLNGLPHGLSMLTTKNRYRVDASLFPGKRIFLGEYRTVSAGEAAISKAQEVYEEFREGIDLDDIEQKELLVEEVKNAAKAEGKRVGAEARVDDFIVQKSSGRKDFGAHLPKCFVKEWSDYQNRHVPCNTNAEGAVKGEKKGMCHAHLTQLKHIADMLGCPLDELLSELSE